MAKAKVQQIAVKLRCDYCHRDENEAALLIQSPTGGTHICDACVRICHDMVLDEEGEIPPFADAVARSGGISTD